MRKFAIALIALLVLVFPAFAQDDMAGDTITDLVVASAGAEEPEFTVLLEAVLTAELAETLADPEAEFTVFAPTDAAFVALLEELGVTAEELLAREDLADILLYHVVAGAVFAETVVTLDGAEVETAQGSTISITVNDDGVFLNDTIQVITTDVEASNGVIHVIDGVLLPPADEDMDGDMGEDMGFGTITDIVVEFASAEEDAEFTVLLDAVLTAELEGVLADPEAEFTVFAPTDAAFVALLEELEIDAETLLGMENLADILLYHVVAGAVFAEDVVTLDGAEVETAQGSTISITVNDDGVFLNDTIQVIITDVEADNGVIHVIDGVLLPPAEETTE